MDRRQFLSATSAATASVVLTTDAGAQLNKDRIRVGQIGTKHAHAVGQFSTCKQLKETFEQVGVVEPDEAQRHKMQNGPYAEATWLTEEALLATPGLQVVAIETEIAELLPTAQRCIDAGLHIHLDKPAGASLPELRKLHRVAAEKRLTIQMGYMFRYNPGFRFLFDAIANRLLGEIFEIDAVMSKTVGDDERREIAKFKGGSMFELGCHLVDPLLHIMGAPDGISSFNRQTRRQHDELFDNTLAVFEYPKATATIRSSVIEVDGNQRRQFIACGDQGTIVIRPLEAPRLFLTLPENRQGFKKGTHEIDLAPSLGRYHGAWTDFAQVIREEKAHKFSTMHDIDVQRAVLAASGMVTWN